jgi:hypothetical protein
MNHVSGGRFLHLLIADAQCLAEYFHRIAVKLFSRFPPAD